MLNFGFWTVFVLFIFLSLFLILLVLIQKGRGGGLSSAFSGGGGGNTAFGSKTGDVLTWTTAAVFGVFMLLAVFLNLIANAKQTRLNATSAVVSTPAAPAAPDSE